VWLLAMFWKDWLASPPPAELQFLESVGRYVEVLLEQAQWMDEIRELRDQNESLIASMPSAIIGLDFLGTVTFWNERAERLFSLHGDEAIGQPLGTLVPAFGPLTEELVRMLQSGDEVADRADALKTREMILEKVEFEDIEGNRKVLILGNDGWPFTVPLVKEGELWRFDVAAGAEELLNRRIGKNELLTLATLHGFVDAQREYREAGHDGNPPAYAQKFWSDEGKHNGLYWPPTPGEPESPMGDLVAQAAGEGYSRDDAPAPDPYHGYFYRILESQGKSAPGGEKSYLDAKGLMTGGYAAIAWPASYGQGGVMSFIVNQQGIVFQKDLGEETAAAAAAITAYNPDETWDPTGD